MGGLINGTQNHICFLPQLYQNNAWALGVWEGDVSSSAICTDYMRCCQYLH